MGTPRYVAPEQWDAKRCDARSDLYSVGLMIYEAATGQVPYSARPVQAIVAARRTHEVTSLGHLTDLPSHVVDVVDRMLRRARAERPASAVEVMEALLGVTRPLPRLGADVLADVMGASLARRGAA